MKGHFKLESKNVMSVESDGYKAKITVFDYSLDKHKYVSKSITISLEHIGTLIKLRNYPLTTSIYYDILYLVR